MKLISISRDLKCRQITNLKQINDIDDDDASRVEYKVIKLKTIHHKK